MRRARFSALFAALVLAAAVAGACADFSGDTPPPNEDAGPGDAATAQDTSTTPDTSAPDAGSDGAPRTCEPSCPSGTTCDDGTCLPTPCGGDAGVVILRPKSLVDQNGNLASVPANLSIDATLRESGEGDGDGTYVSARIGTGNAALRLATELFRLPQGRAIDSVYIRARARREDPASSTSIGMIYWFKQGLLGQNPKTPVGTSYGIADFYLKAPYIIEPSATWTEQIVNEMQITVEMIGAAGNDPNAAVRLTQVWVEVCLSAP